MENRGKGCPLNCVLGDPEYVGCSYKGGNMLQNVVGLLFIGVSIFFLIQRKKEPKQWKRNIGLLLASLPLVALMGRYSLQKNGEVRIYPSLKEAFAGTCQGIFVDSVEGKGSSLIVYMDDDGNYCTSYFQHEDQGYRLMDQDTQSTPKYGRSGTMSAQIDMIDTGEVCDQYFIAEGISDGLDITISEDQISNLRIYKELPVIPVDSTKFIAVGLLNTGSTLDQVAIRSGSGVTSIDLDE